jgi:hypothetical protein
MPHGEAPHGEAPHALVRVEPGHKRVRAYLGGGLVVDTPRCST